MKKYRTTEKHPELKNKVITRRLEVDYYYCKFDTCKRSTMNLSGNEFDEWLSEGWIEEIQEPKFTKDDMIDFLCFVHISNDRHNELTAIEFVDEWLKLKKNEDKNK